jgi:surface carbohydrate biosynthesis protein (TIGR04326 family)
MSTVILGNDDAALGRALAGVPGPVRLLVLADGEEARRVRAAIVGSGQCTELARGEVIRARRDDFRQRYIEFLAALNEANHSKLWWAMPFTTKNPLATPLCGSVFETMLIADLAEGDARPLVVVTDGADVAEQLVIWGRARGARVIDTVLRRGARWRRVAKRALPAVLALAAVALIRTWLAARRWRRAVTRRPHVVVTTLVHEHSFTKEGTYRDAYFGPLPAWLVARGVPTLLFALLIERPGERLLARLRDTTMPCAVMPVEAAMSLGDLLRCLGQAFARWARPFRVRGVTTIGGVDVRLLLEAAVRDACANGTFMMHLRLYHAARGLARRVRVDRCVYPYENRAFEKMLLTGLREAEPSARLVGYNHASITLSHTNFVIGSGEVKSLPLPDTILTVGSVVKDWLESHGGYPPGVLRAACALRQSAPSTANGARRVPIRDMVLTLATSLTEYVRTLTLLEAAWAEQPPYRLRIRPHPTIPLEEGLRRAGLSRHDFFTPDTLPLSESLATADVVLYASSTVGLEGLARGIPAVYLDLEDVLETDPMLGWNRFKWTVRDPADLANVLAEIVALPDGEYAARRSEGIEYATRYLEPVSDHALTRFLDA